MRICEFALRVLKVKRDIDNGAESFSQKFREPAQQYPVSLVAIFLWKRDLNDRAVTALKRRSASSASVQIAVRESDVPMIVLYTRSSLPLWSYAPEEVIGRTAIEHGTWANEQERKQTLKTLIESGTVRNLEIPIRTKAGEQRIVLLHADVIELSGRRCIIGIIEDITARRQAESKLRDTEERFSKAFQSQIPAASPSPNSRAAGISRSMRASVAF